MSRINYTGFFFPYTAEANVNVDSPLCMLPSTIAHELAHQRGVAGRTRRILWPFWPAWKAATQTLYTPLP